MQPINYLDGFSGYGGFHLALKQSGYVFNKVWFSEIDKYAIANYRYNNPDSIHAGSITDIPTNGIIDRLDLFTFGWPCQDNSIAGKRKGQQPGTRSGLLYSAVEVIDKYKPRIFIAENVEGLRSVNKGIDIVESFKILSFLNDSCPQYDIEMQLLNTRWFLPQNRERLYFVGHLRKSGTRKVFPITKGASKNFKEAVQPSDGIVSGAINTKNNSGQLSVGSGTVLIITERGLGHNSLNYSYTETPPLSSRNGASHDIMILSKKYKRGESQGSRVYDMNGISQTINSKGGGQGAKTGLYEIGDKVRRLTPVECERLQGLPDNYTKYGLFNSVIKEISDTQRYALTGNGVSIPVVKSITDKLKVNFS